MVSKRWAVTVVQRYLAEEAAKSGGPALVVMDAGSHRLGWVVGCQGESYLHTRRISDMLVGHGSFLVDGVDGSLHMVHAAADLEHGEWITEYLERVRGVDPLRSRIAGLLARGHRLDALRAVRATAPELGPREAKEYIEAVAAGAPVPERVRSRLPRPPVGFRYCTALSGPNPEPIA